MLMYLYAHWLAALAANRTKLPPNFQYSINQTMDCTERVLQRRDLRRIVDLKIAFDAEA